MREKRHKGVEKGDKAFLESRTGYPAHGEVRVLKWRAGIKASKRQLERLLEL